MPVLPPNQRWSGTERTGRGYIYGIRRPSKPFVRLAGGKGRFRTLPVCGFSNFANLNPYHGGNATERLRG